MKRSTNRVIGLGLAAGATLALLPAGGRAQEIPPPAIALVAGVSQYDLSGTGTVGFASLRLDLPMATWLYAEPGFGTMRYVSQGGERIRHLAAEVQLQGSWPLGRFHPYLGAGAGGFFDLRKQRGGAQFVEPSVSGAGGLRVTLPHGLGVRAELRVRAIGKRFGASMAEWGAGVSKSF